MAELCVGILRYLPGVPSSVSSAGLSLGEMAREALSELAGLEAARRDLETLELVWEHRVLLVSSGAVSPTPRGSSPHNPADLELSARIHMTPMRGMV